MRRNRVQAALGYLITNNLYFRGLHIVERNFAALPEDGVSEIREFIEESDSTDDENVGDDGGDLVDEGE